MSYSVKVLTIVVLTALIGVTNGKESQAGRLFDVQGKSNTSSAQNNGECSCRTYTCGCCQKISIKEIGLDDTVCANVTYLNKDYGIEVTISFDGKVIIDASVSARNPPPICLGIPGLEKIASACLQFHDLNLSNTSFDGCLRFVVRIKLIKVENIELGCFKIPLAEHDVVDKNGLPLKPREVSDRGNVGGENIKRKSGMTDKEKEEFLRRLGLLSKTFGDGKLQNNIVGYQ